jgi:two-component system copper resistance phosphate regulon response regulator CusR
MMSTPIYTETQIITRTSPKRALVVEDSADVAETLQLLLAEKGHEVELATTGKEALAIFKPGKYDLVVTDYSMPSMNGIEMAEIIRRRSANQPILMVTAYAFTIAAYDGRPLPVDHVLRKPFKPEEFQEALLKVTPERKHEAHPQANPDTAFRRRARHHPRPAAAGGTEVLAKSKTSEG